MSTDVVRRPPVIIIGGAANALSIARSLGSFGVDVYGLGCYQAVLGSRFVRPLPLREDGPDPEDAYADFLLGPRGERLAGAVLLAGSDAGITTLARHREALLQRFKLDVSDVEAQLAMLDKLTSYKLAVAAGVPTPKFWEIGTVSDLERHADEYVYPLVVKPLLSHRYQARFPDKFRVVEDLTQLRAAFTDVTAAGLAVMLVEHIPGPDSALRSYYTYIDDTGHHTFDFTKRVVRRYPPGMGLGAHHVTDWNPEVREVSLQLFKHVGLKGLANAEFKLDERDGQLKFMEVNARFTDANALVAAAGLDLARFVYARIVGERYELPSRYDTSLRMVYLSNDWRSFKILRARGELTLAQWLRSLAHRQTFPYLRLDDPMPAFLRGRERVGISVRHKLRRLRARLGRRPGGRAQNWQVGASGTRR